MKRILAGILLFWSDCAICFAQNTANLVNYAVSVRVTATKARPANLNRRYLKVENNCVTANIFVDPNTTATSTSAIKLTPGQSWFPWTIPNGAISIIGDGTCTAVIVTEG